MSPEEREELKAKAEKLTAGVAGFVHSSDFVSARDDYRDHSQPQVILRLLASLEEAEGREAGWKLRASHAEHNLAVMSLAHEKAEQQAAERTRVLRAVQCQAENAAYNLGQPESGWCTKDATRAFHDISGTIEAVLSSDSQEATDV